MFAEEVIHDPDDLIPGSRLGRRPGYCADVADAATQGVSVAREVLRKGPVHDHGSRGLDVSDVKPPAGQQRDSEDVEEDDIHVIEFNRDGGGAVRCAGRRRRGPVDLVYLDFGPRLPARNRCRDGHRGDAGLVLEPPDQLGLDVSEAGGEQARVGLGGRLRPLVHDEPGGQ